MWIKIIYWVIISLICLFFLAVILLYIFQEKLIFFPEKLPADHKFRFERDFKEEFITMPDGEVINAIHFTPPDPSGWIFYLHGNAGSLDGWGERALPFYDRGFACTILDYRGYGKSTGKIDPQNIFSDPAFVFHHSKKQFEGLPVIFYGCSLGTGIATYLADTEDCDGLILETPYLNLGDISSRHYPFIPHNLLLKYPMRTDKRIGNVKCPVYIFHGTEDKVIYYESSTALANHFKEGDELITIPGGGHSDLTGFPQYHRELKRILENIKNNAEPERQTD